jgi:MoaA/NifB/PqqE/SkfB family radical SAM enzyme
VLGNNRIHWTADLLAFYFRRKILDQKVPLLANVKLTYRCNLKCGACPFHHRALEPDSHMSWETATNALAALRMTGCRLVVFEGGEPLLWRDGLHDFSELAACAKQSFLRVAVTTNGTFTLDLPTDIVCVSVDGLKNTHDRLRSNSYDVVRANLLATTHPKVLVHFTINRENWRDLHELAEELRGIPSVRGMTVQLFYPYGQDEEPLALNAAERKEALEKLIGLKKRGYSILNSLSGLKGMIDNTWKCSEDILMNIDPNGQLTRGCYVKSRGQVNCRECGFTPLAEAAGALHFIPGSLLAGWRIFIQR